MNGLSMCSSCVEATAAAAAAAATGVVFNGSFRV